MISVSVKGAGPFVAHLKALRMQTENYVSTEFAKWTVKIFRDLVQNTPQWSGDTAANWRYAVGAPDGSYTQVPDKAIMWPLPDSFKNGTDDPFQRGAWRAVQTALERQALVPAPRYDQKVFFSNNTPVAPDLESNSVYIRPVNLVDGVVAMVSYTAAKYKNLPV